MVRTTTVLATLPVITSGQAAQDVWAASLVVLVGTAAFVLLMATLAARFPNLTVVEYSRLLLGKYLGSLIALIFLWIYVHAAISHVRIYAEIILGTFLPETPMALIIASMVLLAAFVVYLGIENLGRLADLLIPLFAFFIILSLIIASLKVDLQNLQPVLARGFGPIASGTITPIALGVQFLTLGILAPAMIHPEKVVSQSLLAVLFSSLTLVVTSAVVVGVLGPELATNAIFPFFKMMRAVEVTHFLERIEVLAMFAWGFGLLVDVAAFLYACSKGVGQLLGAQNYRPLVAPLAVIWILLSVYAFKDFFTLMRFYKPNIVFPYIMMAVVVPYLILWGVYIIRKFLGLLPGEKRDEKHES